jgi:2-polyprenyl-3-methyl-5-hydroxy-6-metoxy-1,4-benzoquinol methylase
MLKKSDPKFTLETIVERMRAGARRARTVDETSAFHVSASQRPLSLMPDANQFAPGDVPPIVLQSSFQPRSDDHYHVNDLLKYHDRAFVQNAYRAILKRGPDTAGFNTFIEALRSGRLNKIDILARLRYSAEGRAKQVRIKGLSFPAGIRLLYGLPLLGYLLNLVVGLARLPKSIRSEQQFQAHVLAQQEIIAEHSNHLGEVIASLSRETARTFSQSLQGLSEIHRQQIDALTNEQTKRLGALSGEQQAARDELLRRLTKMNERFEAAVRAQQAEGLAQLSLLSKGFEDALADEHSARKRDLNQLIVTLESEQAARKGGLDQLTRAVRDEQAARERGVSQLARALENEQTTRKRALGQLTNVVTDEQTARETGFSKLTQALESDKAAREKGLDQLARALSDEQTTRESSLDHLVRALGDEQAAREKALDGLTLVLRDEQRTSEKAFQTLFQRLTEESARLQNEAAMIEERLVALSDARRTEGQLFARELSAEMQKLFHKQQELRAETALQGERVTRLLDEAGRRLTGPLKSHRLKAFAAEADHALDALYLSLENQFRGTGAEVKQRLRVYLPTVKESRVGRKQTPILDVGCGRGEWLELLREEGLSASGVDSNRVMIQQCRELELKVTQADLMDHLRSMPDASLGAITGFHIIEHLPVETLIKFLDETVRVVKPGGLVILETPNPQNVLVGSCNFYFDPTHRNPLPSPIMKFLLESRGYTGVEVVNLNPSDEAPVAGDSELVRRFNEYFYGPMDYAVVGRRP